MFNFVLGIDRGVDDEDDRMLREFLPEYAENANFWYNGKPSDGNYDTIELSYLDIFNWQKKIYNALTKNEDPKAALVEGLTELYGPVLGEGLMTQVAVDLMRGHDKNGRKIMNEALPPEEQAMEAMTYLLEKVEPGTVTTLRRIKKGADGYVSKSGRRYDLKAEMIAAMSGARLQSVSVADSLGFKAGAYMALQRDASRIFSDVANTKGTLNIEETIDGYQKANERREVHFNEMHALIVKAVKLGVPVDKIPFALQEGGVGTEEIKRLMGGIYAPYEPGVPSRLDPRPKARLKRELGL